MSIKSLIEDEQLSNDRVTLTTANAKALGLLTEENAPSIDGYIVVNNLQNNSFDWSYNFDREGEPEVSRLDFLSVALHEIGHALGFASGIDSQDRVDETSSQERLQAQLDKLTTLDLFRQSERSNAV